MRIYDATYLKYMHKRFAYTLKSQKQLKHLEYFVHACITKSYLSPREDVYANVCVQFRRACLAVFRKMHLIQVRTY